MISRLIQDRDGIGRDEFVWLWNVIYVMFVLHIEAKQKVDYEKTSVPIFFVLHIKVKKIKLFWFKVYNLLIFFVSLQYQT